MQPNFEPRKTSFTISNLIRGFLKTDKELFKPDPKKTYGKVKIEINRAGGMVDGFEDLDSSQISEDINVYSAKRNRRQTYSQIQGESFSGPKNPMRELQQDFQAYQTDMDVDVLSRRISNMADFNLANMDNISIISDSNQSQNFAKKNSISGNDPTIGKMFKRQQKTGLYPTANVIIAEESRSQNPSELNESESSYSFTSSRKSSGSSKSLVSQSSS